MDIICDQEHRYYHSELKLKYPDVHNGWTFFSVSAWENSVNTTIVGVGMILGLRALKSKNCLMETHVQPSSLATVTAMPVMKRIPPSSTMGYLPWLDTFPNITFCSSVETWLLILAKFCLHNSSNRNSEYLTDFSHENSLACQNTKFKKMERKLWIYPTHITAKHAPLLKGYLPITKIVSQRYFARRK